MTGFDTHPLPELGADGLDDFRVSQPLEIQTLLRQMARENVLLTLRAPRGISYPTSLWEVDHQKGFVALDVGPAGPALDRVLNAHILVAVGYLDRIKIQFDVQDLSLVEGMDGNMLICLFPQDLYRFQRRANFRVNPLYSTQPVARVRASPKAEPVELSIFDVSLSGLSLTLPEGLAYEPGTQLTGVEVELDADTGFTVDLTVRWLTSLRPAMPGSRLGCELAGLAGADLRALQRYIDYTQKRRREMAG